MVKERNEQNLLGLLVYNSHQSTVEEVMHGI